MNTKTAAREMIQVNVRLLAHERDSLDEVIFAEGWASMSSWFRQQAIRKIKESSAGAVTVGTHGDGMGAR